MLSRLPKSAALSVESSTSMSDGVGHPETVTRSPRWQAP